jgi:hypothetical protein
MAGGDGGRRRMARDRTNTIFFEETFDCVFGYLIGYSML